MTTFDLCPYESSAADLMLRSGADYFLPSHDKEKTRGMFSDIVHHLKMGRLVILKYKGIGEYEVSAYDTD